MTLKISAGPLLAPSLESRVLKEVWRQSTRFTLMVGSSRISESQTTWTNSQNYFTWRARQREWAAEVLTLQVSCAPRLALIFQKQLSRSPWTPILTLSFARTQKASTQGRLPVLTLPALTTTSSTSNQTKARRHWFKQNKVRISLCPLLGRIQTLSAQLSLERPVKGPSLLSTKGTTSQVTRRNADLWHPIIIQSTFVILLKTKKPFS